MRLWLLWRRSVACWQSVQDNAGHGSLIWLCCSPQYPCCPYLVTTLCVPSLLHTSTRSMHMVHISQLSFYRSLASIHFYSEKLSGLSEPKVVHCWESWVLGLAVKGRRHEEHGHMMRQQYFIFHVTMTRDQRHFCFSASKHLPSAFVISILLKPHKVFRILSQEVAPWIF